MPALSNTPASVTVFRLEAAKSFACGVWFKTLDGTALDLAGAVLTFTAAEEPHRGGATVLTKELTVVDAAAGAAQLNLQAAELNLTAPRAYPFSLTLVQGGYSAVVLKGVVELQANSGPGGGTYDDVNPPQVLEVELERNRVEVVVGHLAARELRIGSVTRVPYGTDPGASFSGAYPFQLLNLSLPEGEPGAPGMGLPGLPGADGVGIVSFERTSGTGEPGTTDIYTVTFSDDSFMHVPVRHGDPGPPGDDGDDGAPGRGIVSFVRTSGTGAAGTTDIYTLTLTDDTTVEVPVYNGSDGDGAGDVTTAQLEAAIATASAADRDRANHTGSQPVATLSDFLESVQDAIGGSIAAGANMTLDYNDATGVTTLSVVAPGEWVNTDPEVVRDTIGGALASAGLISVTVNDAGDTITISTSATQNRSDAATDLLLAGKADTGHNHDGTYAPVAHNHDGTYAPVAHNHDTAYEPLVRAVNPQAGAYTLVLGDASKIIEINSAANVQLTVPTNATVAFPVGTTIQIENINTGDVTIGGAGITFQSASGLKLVDQYAVAEIRKVAADTWRVYGRTSA